jgi:NAD(P)-dependent dehydrogenase (short-subunit alcohol dehydrogenase family)
MILPEFDLRGKVALVTGGGSALGQAIALGLAEAGADVAVACHNQSRGEETARQVEGFDRRSAYMSLPIPLPDPSDAAEIVGQTVAELGGLDILVNAEEAIFAKPLLEISFDEWEDVLNTNLTLTFLFCQAAVRHMLDNGGGRIINLTSGLGERGIANASAYSASKAGIPTLTKALSIELARSGIGVNAIGVGWMEEQGFVTEPVHRFIPMRRPGRPDEIVGAAIYLASAASSIMTGETIYIDGGVLSHG